MSFWKLKIVQNSHATYFKKNISFNSNALAQLVKVKLQNKAMPKEAGVDFRLGHSSDDFK